MHWNAVDEALKAWGAREGLRWGGGGGRGWGVRAVLRSSGSSLTPPPDGVGG